MKVPNRLLVMGVPVDCVDMAGALYCVDDCIQKKGRPGVVLAVNPEKVFVIRENPTLADLFARALLLLPDGIGIVGALRLLCGKKVCRVPGVEFMERICEVAPEKGYRIFIYGGRGDVNRKAVDILRERYPGIQIVGHSNGYVPPEEMHWLIEAINHADVDVLFVGLGSPRQELWIHEYLPKLNVRLCQGIGGTLDTIAGNVRRAPRPFRGLGLEWLYRLVSQPTRFRRQVNLVRFVMELALCRLRECVHRSQNQSCQ